jgi:ankyrin repeat protein
MEELANARQMKKEEYVDLCGALSELFLLGFGSHMPPNFAKALQWRKRAVELLNFQSLPGIWEKPQQQMMPLKRLEDATMPFDSPATEYIAMNNPITRYAELGSFLAWEDLKENTTEFLSALAYYRAGFGGPQPILFCRGNNQSEAEGRQSRLETLIDNSRAIGNLSSIQSGVQAGLLHICAAHGYFSCLKKLVEDFPTETNRGTSFEINGRVVHGETPLFQACRSGHHDIARYLLAHGADATITNAEGETCLHWISSFDDDRVSEMAHLLVKAGGDVHALAGWNLPLQERSQDAGYCGGTPLHRAVSLKNKIAVMALLELGANPLTDGHYFPNEYGKTSLSLAATHHVSDILRLLLKSKKCSADYHNEKTGKSLLYMAIDCRTRVFVVGCTLYEYRMIIHGRRYRQAMINTISLLHHYGADLNHMYTDVDGYSQSALQESVQHSNDAEMVQLILRLHEPDDLVIAVNRRSGQYGFQPLYYALVNGNKEIFTLLLDAGANIRDHVNEPRFGGTPHGFNTYLHHCIKYQKDLFFAEELVRRGTLIDAPDVNGHTPFQLAVSQNNFTLADFLLSRGAEVDRTTPEFGRTLLGNLLSRGHDIPMLQVRYLLEKTRDKVTGKPSFIAHPEYQRSVFHIVCFFDKTRHYNDTGCRAAFEELVQIFPDKKYINHQDTTGFTALDFAVNTQNLEAVIGLLARGADPRIGHAIQLSSMSIEGDPPVDIWEKGEKAVMKYKKLTKDIVDEVERAVKASGAESEESAGSTMSLTFQDLTTRMASHLHVSENYYL